MGPRDDTTSQGNLEQQDQVAAARSVWNAALVRLRQQTSPMNFETYLSATRGLSFDGEASVLRVVASNPFHVPWLERNFGDPIHRAVADVVGAPVRVELAAADPEEPKAGSRSRRSRGTPQPSMDSLLEAHAQAQPHSVGNSPEARAKLHSGSPLNSRYTFASFVVGQSNQLAHAASQAVAEEPGHAYNPLFLYGGVGLGKTHLLHAIGNAVLAKGLSVVYVSSETFTNEMIESIWKHRTDDFRAKYRRARVLLIDDVQFIAGKERTEEEFFHTFNAIHEAGGQIVLSSDRPPKAMTVLEDRLRSRFEWGLIADVQAPDFETRVAILRSKLSGSSSTIVPAEVLDFMAQKVQSNIRELEGSLNRLLAYGRHLGLPITVDLAATVLKDLNAPGPASNGITAEAVLTAVARLFGVKVDALKGKARHKEVVVPRQVAMYLLREDARLSTTEVGRVLNRDHTTVLHGSNIVLEDIARGGPLRSSVRSVREVLAAASRSA